MSAELFSLKNKIAVVTGANTGLGQAMAVALAAAGADIALVGRTAPDESVEKIHAFGRNTAVVMADLSSTKSVANVIAQSERELGPIDILVNNAGIIRRQDALEFSEADWDDVLATNLKVPFFLAQAVAKSMVEGQRGGKIINVASLLSLQGGSRVASYPASKSALAGLTR
jgi:2-deoxy-D-gluconate 3-dehydrogenase